MDALFKMGPDSAEMRELAARICRDYLKGPWRNVTAQTIGFKHISGGLSNILYYISLPRNVSALPQRPNAKEHQQQQDQQQQQRRMPHVRRQSQACEQVPKEVLIRVYGPTHGDRGIEHMITESVIFTLLSERGLGPKLYGLFPGGRIEQYINARPLRTGELAEPKLSCLIARKMAVIHSMEVPLHKDPGWLWETIDRWLKSTETILKGNVPDHAQRLTKVDYHKELKFIRRCIEEINCPVVFCHNDMQEGNILVMQDRNVDEGTRLVLIDFEYCSYNYRSYDLANHFIEWVYDYSVQSPPFYRETLANYPTLEQQVTFINNYLDGMGRKGDSPERIMREVKVFTMATHFFWCLWSVVNAATSVIPFGYWDYAISRYNGYVKTKEDLVRKKRKSSEVD